MAKPKCDACEELREKAPNLIVNGLGETECTSLKNNTGLNPSSENNDCDDLNNLNDCLIGNMEAEIDAYDVCDWKEFMRKFIENAWTVFKGIICAVCGLWAQMSSILSRLSKVECETSYLFEGATFRIGEAATGSSYIVAGKGVSFLIPAQSPTSADVGITYIAGGLATLYGSYRFFTENFTDSGSCTNFDNGTAERTSTSRKGNDVWGTSPNALINGGELISEMRIKMSDFPQIKRFFAGFGQENAGGSYQVRIVPFTAGNYAYGQHGYCNDDGSPASSGMDGGHLVPSGYVYLQLRMTSLFDAIGNDKQLSPRTFLGIRMSDKNITC